MKFRPNDNVATSTYGNNETKIWNGTSWIQARPKIWDGNGWINEVGVKNDFNVIGPSDAGGSSVCGIQIKSNGTITDSRDVYLTNWIHGSTLNSFNVNNYVMDVYEDPSTSGVTFYQKPNNWYGFQNLNNGSNQYSNYYYDQGRSLPSWINDFYYTTYFWCILRQPQSGFKKIELRLYEKNKSYDYTKPMNIVNNWPYGSLISSTSITLFYNSGTPL